MTNATDQMITRRMRQGYRLDETVSLLDELIATAGSADNLAAALVYQGFATARTAERFVASITVCGYICKQCAHPSPVGIGYTVDGWEAANASAGRTNCACGYSNKL